MIESSAFENAYRRYGLLLYKLAAVYLGCRQDAEDACHTAFVRLLTAAPRFNDAEHEKAWLLRVTVNICKDMLKRRERQHMELTPDIIGKTEGSALGDILALPVKYREALVLHYYYGYSVRELACMLRVSKSAVKMRLQRGRALLQMELGETK